MAIKGMVGAVYQNNTAPISDNIALILNWTLEVEHRKEYTYGPELYAIPTGWGVKAEAYWALETMSQGQYFVRLFIGKGKDKHCLTGQVKLSAIKKTNGINEMEIRLEGIGKLIQED